MKKKLVVIAVVAVLIVLSVVWFLGGIQVKKAIEAELSEDGLVYERIEMGGYPFSYKASIYNPEVRGSESLIDTGLVQLQLGLFGIDAKNIKIAMPDGIIINHISGKVINIGKVRGSFNIEDGTVVKDIYINIKDLSFDDSQIKTDLLVDIEGINMPLDKESPSVYVNQPMKLNKFLLKGDSLKISAKGDWVIDGAKFTEGGAKFNIGGYEGMLNSLVEEVIIPKESATLIVDVLDSLATKPDARNKKIDIYISAEEGGNTIAGKPAAEVIQKISKENSEAMMLGVMLYYQLMMGFNGSPTEVPAPQVQ